MGSRKTERFGRHAEMIASLWLRLKGYRILAHRVRTRVGEIDLVCRRAHCLVFVEVKGRVSTELALHALRPRQQQRIAAAAHYFLKMRPRLAHLDCRFDLITVDHYGRPRHVMDVWRVNGY